MAIRIERIWNNLVEVNPLRKKEKNNLTALGDGGRESPVGYDASHEKDSKKDQQSDQNKSENQVQYSQEEIQNAISSLSQNPNFLSTGMTITLIQTKDSNKIQLTHKLGQVIKVLNIDEFMQLKSSFALENQSRGKILDQKF